MKSKWTLMALILTALFILPATPISAVSTTVVIGEFRTRGPNGGNDEFIELYNLSSSAIDIGGWKVNGSSNSGTTGTRATIPSGTILQPYQHYLLTNTSTTGGPYSGSTIGNLTYSSGINDDGGIALLNGSAVIIDQVGMSAGSAYKEGTILTPMTINKDQSYARKPDTLSSLGGHKNGVDTDDNAADFLYNDGNSSPENMGSPNAISLRSLSAATAPGAQAFVLPLLALLAAGGLVAWRRQ